MNKEDNLKEKFKQALISTVKAISNDFKLFDCKYPSIAMGNSIKNAAAGVGTPLK